jgi:hypothetical protein
LLHHVNEQRQIVSDFPDTPEAESIAPADAIKIRDVLWADDKLREDFIAANPAELSPDDLALVASWQYRLAGRFFVFRYLKKYSIFLSERNPVHAYGVLGLVSPIEEIIGPFLPVYVEAVLLPFEDQIIYDGLMAPFSVSFGPGVRAELNDTYRYAQEREGIITTLIPSHSPTSLREEHRVMLTRHNKLLSVFRRDLFKAGLSEKTVEQHVKTIDTFAQTSLLTQNPPRGLLDMTMADVKAYFATTENKINVTSFKRFVRFLAETGRMGFDQEISIKDFLNQVRE